MILLWAYRIIGVVAGTYYYLRLKHYERMADALRRLVPNQYALEKPVIQKYVKDAIDLL